MGASVIIRRIAEPKPTVRITEVRHPSQRDFTPSAPVVFDQGEDVGLSMLDYTVLLALITRTMSSQPNQLQLLALRGKLRALIAAGGE